MDPIIEILSKMYTVNLDQMVIIQTRREAANVCDQINQLFRKEVISKNNIPGHPGCIIKVIEYPPPLYVSKVASFYILNRVNGLDHLEGDLIATALFCGDLESVQPILGKMTKLKMGDCILLATLYFKSSQTYPYWNEFSAGQKNLVTHLLRLFEPES